MWMVPFAGSEDFREDSVETLQLNFSLLKENFSEQVDDDITLDRCMILTLTSALRIENYDIEKFLLKLLTLKRKITTRTKTKIMMVKQSRTKNRGYKKSNTNYERFRLIFTIWRINPEVFRRYFLRF